ncbi:phosphopantothenoylcysteine decarboxylase/phosphopantothenate--cysteine ligase [Microbacterium sp. AG1240]|uniref:bifunctional phosphopantothenoylcysteine decarboxylase/phosphopantothenate--cysteine ligase CoaBC n=1 Tax=Microbacterium sp. AG1240 TaxID=2183992 RepID=UPI000EB3788B|nr:bifunctional phosphopantothenoylcysteine decarboxylase/phosphopantothenate--cysteine ligase CoaBC [Microbacterium sp. AG1240]RKT33182.1 phosphopantothenoylcysteine decarboxylase/phosphopantothenate--cysteine ligase [Microbacterium sp. AG1240]
MFIVVGVTGGIAAYKSVHLVRLLVTSGHDVHVVPTDDALRFVGLTTWEAISRHPVTTSVHDDVAEVRHVALGRSADLVIVAPATANTLAGMAAGLAKDLLGTTLLATSAPVLVAPAMHTEMWNHPATRANVDTLRARGVHVVGPESGPLTGGDSGPGRMSEPDAIAGAALALLAPRADLDGLAVAVSTGGTREPIDPVRFLGNRSSGRQGAAVALAAADRGARVVLVAAHVDDGALAEAALHPRIRIERVGTAAELDVAMEREAVTADAVVMVAAVADYRAAHVPDRKLSKEDAAGPGLTLELVRTPDVLAGLAERRRVAQTIVGFAAETAADDDDLLARARRKAARKGVDLLVANDVAGATGFGTADNDVVVIDGAGEVVARARGTKREVADALWDAVLTRRG